MFSLGLEFELFANLSMVERAGLGSDEFITGFSEFVETLNFVNGLTATPSPKGLADVLFGVLFDSVMESSSCLISSSKSVDVFWLSSASRGRDVSRADLSSLSSVDAVSDAGLRSTIQNYDLCLWASLYAHTCSILDLCTAWERYHFSNKDN